MATTYRVLLAAVCLAAARFATRHRRLLRGRPAACLLDVFIISSGESFRRRGVGFVPQGR